MIRKMMMITKKEKNGGKYQDFCKEIHNVLFRL